MNALLGYFNDLPCKGHGSPQILAENLRAIGNHHLAPEELTDITVTIASYIQRQSTLCLKKSGQLFHTFVYNGAALFDQLEKALRVGRPQHQQLTGMDTVALAEALIWLGIRPSDQFAHSMCDLLNQKLILKDMSNCGRLKLARLLCVWETLLPDEKVKNTAINIVTGLHHAHLSPQATRGAIHLSHFLGISVNGWRAFSEDSSVSKIEVDLTGVFKEAAPPKGIMIMRNCVVESIQHVPDFIVERQGRTAVLELDGPTHFVGSGHLNGPTRLMTGLLSRLYPKTPVIRLPSEVARSWLKNANSVPGFLFEALLQDPGGYLYGAATGFKQFLPTRRPAV